MSESIGGEDTFPATTDAELFTAAGVFIFPFILIPSGILAVRLAKMLYKFYQAKKYGYDNHIFEDPLAELGLNLNRGYENTAQIRKIRKEQRKLMQEIERKNQSIQEARNMEKLARQDQPQYMFLRPIHAAEDFLTTLRRQTKETWMENYSPDAVRRWVSTSRYGRAWMVFQVFVTLLAIVNYVALTYLVNKDQAQQKTTIKDLDLVYSIVFLLDYMLSFYIAEDRLKFYFSPMPLVDLVSIVTPFIYLFVKAPSQWVWFVGLIRIFRATRILRTYRILSFSQTEETRELITFILNFLNFVFFSASVINATETLIEQSKQPASLTNWHDSLYYIMVTFSTIGFGDLTPSSTISRIIVMMLIVLVIVYVPYQTGKILEVYNSLSPYQRAKYYPSSSYSHIILGGSATYSDIIDFCREYFVADSSGRVVILRSGAPDVELRRFLNHPFYRNRLIYMQGDITSLPDLKRAAADFATGIFLLNSTTETSQFMDEEQEIQQTRGLDAQLLMQALVVKNSFPGLPVLAQVKDTRSKDLAHHCGCDRVLCIEEVQAALYAGNCIVPGLLALVPNLVHTYQALNNNLSDMWVQEYQCGISNQIYSFKIPTGLVGIRFKDVVYEVYSSYSAMVFALVSMNSGFNKNSIRIGIDKNYRVKADDIAICICEGGEDIMLRIAIHYKHSAVQDELAQKDLEMEMDKVLKKSHTPVDIEFSPDRPDLDEIQYEQVEVGKVPSQMKKHLILCGHLNSRKVRHFVKSLRARESAINSPQFPIVCIVEKVPDVTHGIWSDILSYGNVFLCQGTSMKKTVLQKAKIETCAQVIIFTRRAQEMKDSVSIFLVKMIQTVH